MLLSGVINEEMTYFLVTAQNCSVGVICLQNCPGKIIFHEADDEGRWINGNIYNKRNHNSDLLFSINGIINDLKITYPMFILSGGHFNLIPDEWLNRDPSKLNFSQVNKSIALQGF